MEKLTSQQIVLLTLLVSFVTSLATGIFTVSLMEQAPQSMLQTVNRVVQRTVERVVQAPAPTPSGTSNNTQTAALVTKETIVVRSDDLVVQAIEKNKRNITRVMRIEGDGDFRKDVFAGMGLVLSKDGLIATDATLESRTIDSQGNIILTRYYILGANGKEYRLAEMSTDTNAGIIIYGALDADGKRIAQNIFTPVVLGDSAGVKLGQAVISIGGGNEDSVQSGVVSSIAQKKVTDDSATSTVLSETRIIPLLRTDISDADIVSGAMLVNLSGDIIGFKSKALDERNSFISSAGIKGVFEHYLKITKLGL
jgi:hypothetical protein